MRVERRGWPRLHRVDPLGPVSEALVDFRGVVQHRVAAAAAADRVGITSAVQPVVVSRVVGIRLTVVTLQDVVPAGPVQAVVTIAADQDVVARLGISTPGVSGSAETLIAKKRADRQPAPHHPRRRWRGWLRNRSS
jgi:hypothetical protein